MTLAEVAIVFGLISTGVGALAGFLTAMATLRKSKADADQAGATAQKAQAEANKADADTGHTLVDTTTDLITQIKSVYESRISMMESKIKDLEAGRKRDCEMIVSLNTQLGTMRQTAELQSGQISLWRSRVEELLLLLRQHKIVLPDWAQPEEGKNVE